MAINSFKDLTVWQKSMELIPEVYNIARQLPAHEKFGLADQLRRAVISIPSNIAEGSKRSSRADFRQFCKIAAGSSAEVETQLLAVELLYPAIDVEAALKNLTVIQKMLTVLMRRLSNTPSTTNHKP